ncbi:MAG: MATE family efflux transporter [Christensenellales bacterium]
MGRIFVRDRKFYLTALALALPVVLQNMITIGVNIADTMMLGSYGETQIAGSSLANDFINIFHILCMGMGGGAAVLTAQYWGRGDTASLKRALTIMIRIALLTALLFTAVTALFPSGIMRLFTKEAPVIEKGSIYFLWSLPTYLLMGLSLTLTLILRSMRKVLLPLISSIICFFVNIFFNWMFIFGNLGAPEMQIAGAALGTVIARVVETAIIAGYVFVFDKSIGYRIKDILRPCGDLVRPYLRYSLPVMLSDSLLAVGNAMVSVIMGHLRMEFVAANAIIAMIVRLSTVFTQGLGQASAVMTGNTLGRGEKEKAYRQGVTFFALSIVIGILAAGVILALSPFIISRFNITQETRAIARQLMFAVSIMVVFQATQSVLTKGVLRGGGDTVFLVFADVAFLWAASIPLGALCGFVWHTEPFFIYIALKIDWAIKTVICAWRLRSKKWMRTV